MFPGSTVVTEKIGEVNGAFAEWLPGAHAHLIYRASRDGYTVEAYDAAREAAGVTPVQTKMVTLVKSTNGCVFGGYEHETSRQGFLFTVTNPHGTPITRFMSKASEIAMTRSVSKGREYDLSRHSDHFGFERDIQLFHPHPSIEGRVRSAAFFPWAYIDTLGYGKGTFTGAIDFVPEDVEVWMIKVVCVCGWR